MQFPCRITRTPDGSWTAQHDSANLGRVRVTAATREAAAAKLKAELRYRLEICPCTGELYDTVNIDLVEQAP
jgi:hypothetical protein